MCPHTSQPDVQYIEASLPQHFFVQPALNTCADTGVEVIFLQLCFVLFNRCWLLLDKLLELNNDTKALLDLSHADRFQRSGALLQVTQGIVNDAQPYQLASLIFVLLQSFSDWPWLQRMKRWLQDIHRQMTVGVLRVDKPVLDSQEDIWKGGPVADCHLAIHNGHRHFGTVGVPLQHEMPLLKIADVLAVGQETVVYHVQAWGNERSLHPWNQLCPKTSAVDHAVGPLKVLLTDPLQISHARVLANRVPSFVQHALSPKGHLFLIICLQLIKLLVTGDVEGTNFVTLGHPLFAIHLP
mmetsp:Transcript_124552/g.215869  ORF Transcript_124552/g.215869 Transcript_124552/m.215869 type:complete len:297 (+) Transcript_124552:907-1797(+)